MDSPDSSPSELNADATVEMIQNALDNRAILPEQLALAAYLGQSAAVAVQQKINREVVFSASHPDHAIQEFTVDLCEWGEQVQVKLIEFYSGFFENQFDLQIDRFARASKELGSELAQVISIAREASELDDLRNSAHWNHFSKILFDTQSKVERVRSTDPEISIATVRAVSKLIVGVVHLIQARLCDEKYAEALSNDAEFAPHKRVKQLSRCGWQLETQVGIEFGAFTEQLSAFILPWLFSEPRPEVARKNCLNQVRLKNIQNDFQLVDRAEQLGIFDPYWSVFVRRNNYDFQQDWSEVWPSDLRSFSCVFVTRNSKAVKHVVAFFAEKSSDDYIAGDRAVVNAFHNTSYSHQVDLFCDSTINECMTQSELLSYLKAVDYVVKHSLTETRRAKLSSRIPVSMTYGAEALFLDNSAEVISLLSNELVSELYLCDNDSSFDLLTEQQKVLDWLSENEQLKSSVIIHKPYGQ